MNEQTATFFDRVANGFTQIAERLPEVIGNPLGYREEAFVLAVIVALLALAIVLVALVLVESVPTWAMRRELGYHRRWDRIALRAAIVVSVLVAVFVAVTLAPLVPPVGKACSACHTLAPAVAAWETDAHADISCYGCHARSGIIGALQAGTLGATRLLRTSGEIAGAAVFERGCLSCHDQVAEGVTDGVIRMRHSDVIEAGYRCVSCHPTVGHTDMEREPLPVERSRMSTCLVCHDGVAAPSECTVCHDGPPSDPEVIARSGMTDAPVTCEGCHSEETDRGCVECHGLVLPHPVEFMGEHARLSARSPSLCARCHETANTSGACECHADVNVHGTYSDWFPRHGPMAQTSWPGGCLCHADSFCLFCHERIP